MILPMKHATIVCMKQSRQAVLAALQKCGEFMPDETPNTPSDAALQGEFRKAEELLHTLQPYAPKAKPFSGAPEVDFADFAARNPQYEQTAAQARQLLETISALKDQQGRTQDTINKLLPWRALSSPLEHFRPGPYASSFLLQGSQRSFDLLCGQSAGLQADFELVNTVGTTVYFTAVCINEALPAFKASLTELAVQSADVPVQTGTVEKALKQLEEQLAQLQQKQQQSMEQLTALCADITELKLLCEQYRALMERDSLQPPQTEETFYLEGWVREKGCEHLEQALKKASDGVYSLEIRDPLPDEVVPTALQNNHITSQFECVTEMFTTPGYNELDPNPVMAPWYWIIFGLMMGDAGYGLMMLVLIFAFKKLVKPKGSMGQLTNVLFYSSIPTIIFGVLFGSYFGETWNPILFAPMEEPVKMLIFTLGVGVLHIFTGLVTKAVYNIRHGDPFAAVFDQLSWMLIIGGICMLFLPATSTAGTVLAVAGAAIVLFTAGRAKKGVFGKITGGLVGLYGITSYMSDILSYSRILALSLATGVVGMVMNLLAGMIVGNPIGFVFALLIYVVGHVFNLALGLLSAYVHDCRLQYIEFFGKFFDGGGKNFKPFAIRTRYVQIKDEN